MSIVKPIYLAFIGTYLLHCSAGIAIAKLRTNLFGDTPETNQAAFALQCILPKIVGIKIYLLDILKKMHGEEKSLMNGRLTIKDNPIL